MKTNFVRQKLRAGESSIGTWLTLASTSAAAFMARTAFDWLTVELEHTPATLETAATCYSIIAANGKIPLVRVPWNSQENIKRVLDTGAFGIIVPMVNTRAEAEAAVGAARYAPLGYRSIGGQLHAATFQTDAATYYAKANEEILVVVMIEHIKAIENAEQILSVPGIDAYFIGPNDLHHSMGLAPRFESNEPIFVNALDHVRQIAKKYNVASGIHVADAAAAKRRRAEGYQFIAVASETGFMLTKAAEVAKELSLGCDSAMVKY